MSYFDRNPVRSKKIAPEMERLFCKTYADKIRMANSINTNGNKIMQMVSIKRLNGTNEITMVGLN